jgi:hypothetical protein
MNRVNDHHKSMESLVMVTRVVYYEVDDTTVHTTVGSFFMETDS